MITDADFEQIVSYMKREAGIDFSNKRTLVTTRLESYFSKIGCHDPKLYLEQAMGSSTGQEMESLINLLTTNHTFFWREEKHFEFLQQEVLPELKKKCATTRDIRIWCAASSSGEEPYTLAMVLMSYFGNEQALWDTTVLATDISTKVLRRAQQGVYAKESIKNLPVDWQMRFFTRQADSVTVIPELKEQVLFRKLNLMDPFPFRKKLHVIFARNVLIYFNEDVKTRVVEKMVDSLVPGGYLFIGTTESVSKNTNRLEYVMPSVYRKK